MNSLSSTIRILGSLFYLYLIELRVLIFGVVLTSLILLLLLNSYVLLIFLSSRIKLNIEPLPNSDLTYKPFYLSSLYVKYSLNFLLMCNPKPVPA